MVTVGIKSINLKSTGLTTVSDSNVRTNTTVCFSKFLLKVKLIFFFKVAKISGIYHRISEKI